MLVISYSDQEEECRENTILTSGNIFCELDIIIGVWLRSIWIVRCKEIVRAEAGFLDLCADFRNFVRSLV